MRLCPDGKPRVPANWDGKQSILLLLLGIGALSCRIGLTDSATRTSEAPITVMRPATNALPSARSTNEEGKVISIYVSETGDVLWDGEPVSQQTLRERLATVRPEDTIAWYGGPPLPTMSIPQQSVFESILKLGLRTVWVQDDAAGASEQGAGRPITVNTKYIREALTLYDRLKGADNQDRKLLPADIVVRLEPDAQEGYVLRRVEVGLIGQSIWIVHESLSEAESATSIQLKKEW